MERASLEAGAVAGEEQGRADKVNGADDDGEAGRISRPFAVVGELATKGGNSEFVFADSLLEFFRLHSRLIDNRSPINNVNKAARKVLIDFSRDEPNRHDHCLAKAGRKINDRRQNAVRVLEMLAKERRLP